MNDEALLLRIERFERTVATCGSIVPVVFSLQCISVALGAPTFASMFADFGAKLPWATQFLLNAWPVLVLVAVIVPIVAVVIARKGGSVFSLVFSTVAGLVVFLLAQFMTLALFLPIFQLGAVAAGG